MNCRTTHENLKLARRALCALAPLALLGCQHTPPAANGAALSAVPASEEQLGDGCRAGETRLACDRRAILAMTGEYRVGFAFDEVSALRANYTLKKPQRSGGEEWVTVIEDSGTHIALQHTLVDAGGEVTKHWRQDWDYQPRVSWRFVGHDTWERRELAPDEVKNAWVQSVWQVDDSPRYAGVGRWMHNGNTHVWTSENEWRPLPRREHTTRKDYDVIDAVNRHEISADGWVQLEDNLKLDTGAAPENRYLAREFGVNRYQRISDFNFKPGRDYWAKTRDFWQQVRAGWAERLAHAQRIRVREKIDDKILLMAMLEAAEAEGPRDAASLKKRSDELLDRYLEITPLAAGGK